MTDVQNKKETAIHDEQQLNQNKVIVDNIISILAENNLSITESRNILNIVSRKLGQQTVRVSS